MRKHSTYDRYRPLHEQRLANADNRNLVSPGKSQPGRTEIDAPSRSWLELARPCGVRDVASWPRTISHRPRA